MHHAIPRQHGNILGGGKARIRQRSDLALSVILQGSLVEIHVADNAGITEHDQNHDSKQDTAQEFHGA